MLRAIPYRSFGLALVTAALVWPLAVVPAAAADDPAQTLRRKVAEAYREADTYHAVITFENSQKQGRWRLIQVFEVAIDRANSRLRVIRPDVEMVDDGQRLYARSDMVARGTYLNIPAPALTYQDLMETAPFLASPVLPGILLTLGEDPMVGGERVKYQDPDPADPAQRPRLTFPGAPGTEVTYLIDPERFQVTGVRWRHSARTAATPGLQSWADMSLEIEIRTHGKALAPELFVFDPGSDRPVGSIAEFVAGDPPPPPGSPEALEGQPAPPVKLKYPDGRPFVLDRVQADVVILDFWATWCAPCRPWLTTLDELLKTDPNRHWCQDQHRHARARGIAAGPSSGGHLRRPSCAALCGHATGASHGPAPLNCAPATNPPPRSTPTPSPAR